MREGKELGVCVGAWSYVLTSNSSGDDVPGKRHGRNINQPQLLPEKVHYLVRGLMPPTLPTSPLKWSLLCLRLKPSQCHHGQAAQTRHT